MNNELWIDKYKPIKSKNIIGQSVAVTRITKILNDKNRRKNCIILTGKNGIGKTLLANVILKELGYNIKNINDSHNLKQTMNVSSFFNKQQDVGIIYESSYVKKIDEDNKLIAKSKQPIIFICDIREMEKYKILKKNSEVIYMRSPSLSEQIKFLSSIYKKEKIKVSKKKIEDACIQSNGDMRFLLTNSHFWSHNLNSDEKDISNYNIFKMIPEFFDYNNTSEEKINEYFIDTSYLPQLLFLNYPNVKIAKIEDDYDKIKKELINNIHNQKIIKAKEISEKTGKKVKKVKKTEPKEEDVNMLYKLTTFSNTIDLMSEADIIDQQIKLKQKFSLIPHFIYSMTESTTNCGGILQEKDIRYTKPKSKLNLDFNRSKIHCSVGCKRNHLLDNITTSIYDTN